MEDTLALTTVDNPYSPFDKFDEWYNFDEDMGYHTCGLLARITITSDALSMADQALAIEYAIDDIIEEDVMGVYLKVTPSFYQR